MTRGNPTKNDVAWEHYFAERDVLTAIAKDGYARIRADDLKAVTNYEPRLLAKHDTKASLPTVFRDNQLTIFPVRNGEYIVFPDELQKTYFELADADYPSTVETYQPALDLTDFDSFPGAAQLNESQALDFAFATSLLRHFTRDHGLYLAIRGRTFSKSFKLVLPGSGHHVDVGSVQIEVDGGYESRDSIVLIEAKVGRRSDFNIRQLYYPYLEWSSRSRKQVIPVFLVVTNGLFYFFRVRFGDALGELTIEEARCFIIDETPVTTIHLTEKLSRVSTEGEPTNIPFPQANDLDKVVDLVALLQDGTASVNEIALHFDFDIRQADYYANAARYLGLARKVIGGFESTKEGNGLAQLAKRHQRTQYLLERMLARPVFAEVYRLLLSRNLDASTLTNGEVATIISRHTKLSESTPPRRASTVLAWLKWLQRNADLAF